MKKKRSRYSASRMQGALLLLLIIALFSCKKDDDATPALTSLSNTSWKVDITLDGKTRTQNIFEFNNGGHFFWHPAGVPSYSGTWSQNGATVTFTFKETNPAGDYYWDNTGMLSNGDSLLTGTMQRRGAQGSGTFTATRL